MGDVDRSIVRERETLGRDGILVIDVVITKENGQLIGNPNILTRGFMLPEELDTMIDGLKRQIKKTVKKTTKELESEIIRSVKSYLYKETKRSPLIFVTVNKIYFIEHRKCEV